MKRYVLEFVRGGLYACGFGPIILAVVYAILGRAGVVDTFSVGEVVTSVLSVALLAFVAGGITVIYKIERLPLIGAILIHAMVLYTDYVVIYLMNGWLKSSFISLAIFTACFVVGFALIWLIIYFTTKKSAERMNEKLGEIHGA